MKHNIERENYETATKEEKARHNGVDTSRWGNDTPRIAVPEGMEDHQHTQQLVRLYLNNDNSFYIFSGNKVLVFLTEKELQTSKVDEVIDGWYVSTYLRVGMTFKGLCLNWHVRKIGIYDDIPEEGYIDPGSSSVKNFNSLIKELEIYRCSDDRKNVIFYDGGIADRQEFIETCVKQNDIRWTGARWSWHKKEM